MIGVRARRRGSDVDWRRSGDLRREVRAGLVWSLCNNAAGRAGQLVTGIVLAHLLAPEVFGVFTVALVAFSLVVNVSEMGVSVALVREPDHTDAIAPTVTTIAVVSASVLAVGCFLSAPTVADVMRTPGAVGSLRILSLAIVVAGATAVPSALVQQQFRQDVRMAADVTSLVVSIGLAVPLAAAGFGPSSLAWAWVASNAASGLVLVWKSPSRHIPGFDPDEARRLLRFGLPLAASSLLVFAILNVDYVVVGRLLGATALGCYVLAFNLASWPVNLFSTSVRAVSLPGFARLLAEPEALRSGFTRSLGQLMAVALPVCALLGALALPAIRLVYGSRWDPAADALRWLAVLGGLRVAFELTYDYLVALGLSRIVLWVQLTWLALLVPVLAAGAHLGGIGGVGLGQIAVAGGVITPIYLGVLARRGIPRRQVGASLVRPVGGAVAAAAVAVCVQRAVPGLVASLAAAGLAGLAVHLLVVWPLVPRRARTLIDTAVSDAA
ncbi:MAG TPA: lipopolysaccharide biosynthesis protein [Acidimicrobiales bacterium]|nr:lipopolysaccharide biosynthesis protein [Acidimicrobiales bacterium]